MLQFKPKNIIQPALEIGQPNDKYEREADWVADAVMRMPDPEEEEQFMNASTPSIQMKCKSCEGEKLQMTPNDQSKTNGENIAGPALTNQLQLFKGNGSGLPSTTQAELGSKMGADFSGVKVHTNSKATQMNRLLGARAFTRGNDIYFNEGEYSPKSSTGKHLLAHELAHVVQQGAATTSPTGAPVVRLGRTAPHIQRAVQYDVLDWDAVALGSPTPMNGPDPRTILIPPTGQISISALVDVLGDRGDACSSHEIGTTQTAWVAWVIMYYRGQTAADGSVTVRYNSQMPMRDPAPAGAVWYDPSNIRSAASCGTAVGVFHRDSPWHNPPKARNNSAVAGNPLVYLMGYRRGLHLVTYLTARDASGNFIPRPLRFRYWNTIQSFDFTPQYPTPVSPAAFLGTWPFSGGITVNIGSAGNGEVGDAPYYTTAGIDYNSHFNNINNWTITEHP